MNSTTTPQLTPEAFKEGTLKAHPDWINSVASDGTKYSDMDPIDFTRRFATRYPDAVTSTGHKYSDYLPPTPPEPISNNGSDEGILNKLSNRVGDVVQTTKDVYSGKTAAPLGGVHLAGQIGGAVTDVAGSLIGGVNKVARVIPGVASLEDSATNALASGVTSAAQSPVGQAVIKGAQSFAQNNPKTTQVIKDLGNVVGGVTTLEGAGALKGAVTKAFGRDALTTVAEDIAPQLSGKTGARALAKGGTEKQGLFRKIVPVVSDSLKGNAQTVLDNVPNYLKLSTYADKLNAVKDAVGTMAESLKNDVIQSGKDKIFPFKELSSSLRSIPIPDSMTRDLEPVYNRVIGKAVQIAKDSGGKISDLFDARKAFDAYVADTFPNLYTNLAETPIKVAIKNIRNGMNDFIEKNLADVPDFRKRLLDQSTLFKAAENLAPQAMKEIGTGGIERFIGRHPAIKGALGVTKKYVLPAAGVGGGLGLFQRMFGQR